MQIRLTVLGPLSGHHSTAPAVPAATCACDVLVTAPAGTALAGVTSGLAAAAAAAGCDLGTGAVVVYAGAERLDPQRSAVGEPPLIDGAVLSLSAPADPERHAGVLMSGVPEAAARLHVVSGPDAGGVHLLHGGEVHVGRSATADIPLDDPDVSRLHCAVVLHDDGTITLRDLGSTNGTVLAGEPVGAEPVRLPAGELLRVGESVLSLHAADDSSPRVLPAAPDGEGHLRVGGSAPGASPAGAVAPPVRGAWLGAPAGVTGATGPTAGTGGGAARSGPGDTVTHGGRGFALRDAGPGALSVRVPAQPGPAGTPSQDGATPPRGTASGTAPAGRTGRAAGFGGPLNQGQAPDDGTAPYGAGAASRTGQPGGQFGQDHGAGPYGPGSGADAPGRPGGFGSVLPGHGHGPAQGNGQDAHGAGSGADAAGRTGQPGGPGFGGILPGQHHGPARDSGADPYGPGSGADAPGRPGGFGSVLPGQNHGPAQDSGADPYAGGFGQRAYPGGPGDAGADSQYGHPGRPGGSGHGGLHAQPGDAAQAGHHAPGGHLPPQGGDRTGSPYGSGHSDRPVDISHSPPPGDAGTAQPGHPGGAGTAESPAGETGKRNRGRGIGAWARRLAGGRGGRGADGDAWGGPQDDTGTEDQARAEAAALRERWPDPAETLLTALGPGPRLWERGPGHPDLLTVRLGTADRHAPGSGALLPSVPVTVALREAGSLGLAGPRGRLSALARSVLAQLAALHAPASLEFVLISADRARPVEERLAEWSWLGWLPQLRPVRGQDCRLLVAYDREQAAARTAELVRRLDEGPLGPHWAAAAPAAVAAAAERHSGPYTVVIVDGDPGSAELRETVSRLAVGGSAAGIHLVCLADAPATTPASPVASTLATARTAAPAFPYCGAVALLSGDVATVVQVIHRAPVQHAAAQHDARAEAEAPSGPAVIAAVDAVSRAWAERFARALAPLRMADGVAGGAAARVAAALPRSARLLDELGLARATPASLTARWAAATDRGSRPGGRAVAVLGAGPHGPLAVDLAADGPHLLVEGCAGSGKTELLRSLAASLAAADRPDRLSLVLVDGTGAERGEGLRLCTDLPHVSTYLAAADPVRMREFAQALTSELKRRAELLGRLDFTAWHTQRAATSAAQVVAPRRAADGSGDLESVPTGTLKLRTQKDGPSLTARTALPRLVVLVDDFDALVAPALGSTGRPSAGSVVRALEAVARDGERLGVHLVAASGRPDRTADTAAVERAGLRATLEIAPPSADGTPGDGSGAGEPAPGRGRLMRPDDDATTPFQAGRVTGRIPRTATLRPTVVAIDWQRMGDPPTRRPVRELGNGPTDLALLASALQRAAQSAGAEAAPPLL
ncbi:FHA domain-containing protein [Streptomyces roseoverticillatus]|uniref:FtsK/SpoIIIE domain-containing protein n=1 Tax=Streptomyces roseoverticillatus TaxID=66429 RepID=UPI001F2AB37E|nr:FtsK/SpoIIIE domain-containing protein [Streptomyces roseoverticillatus]MCF3104552.1 FHA domain-containing protein [Streptomyces roseoverticillatus]